MNKLISKIKTVQNLRNNTERKTFEICENENVGKPRTLGGALQKKFIVYEITRRIGHAGPLKRQQGDFGSIKECEKAIESSSRISFNEKGWYKSIETEQDKKGDIIINWVKRIKTTYDEKNQIINGIKQFFHGNGILSSLYSYRDGQLHDTKSWDTNGFYSHQEIYEEEKRETEQDGKGDTIINPVKRIKTTYDENNQIINGIKQFFHGNGILSSYDTYKDGQLHGISKSWDVNGYLRFQGIYEDGKKEGEHIGFDEYGKFEEMISFKKDKLDGVVKKIVYTSEVGKYFIQELYTYKENKLHGLYKIWYSNGVLNEERNYYDGKLNGSSKYYDRAGKILTNEWHENGVKKDTQN